jgi:hypothetical protein
MADQPQIMDLRTFGRNVLGRQPGYKPTKQELSADIALYRQYQNEAVKQTRPAFTPSATEVSLPDGRKVPMYRQSAGSWQVLPQPEAPKFERITAADGTVKLIDTMTKACAGLPPAQQSQAAIDAGATWLAGIRQALDVARLPSGAKATGNQT